MMTDNNVLPTSEVAELLGTSSDVIRKRKQRHTDKLIENQHWYKDSGTTFWTNQGIEALRELLGQDETDNIVPVSGTETSHVAQDETQDETIAAFLDELVESAAAPIADEFWRRLPGAVITKIRNPSPRVRAEFSQQIRTAFSNQFTPLLTAGMPEV